MNEQDNKFRSATTVQASSIIRQQLDLLGADPKMAHQLPPVMLWGAPGIGKSSIIQQICEDADVGFVDIRLSQREPVDLRGLPVPKEDHVDWLLSGEWPRDPNSRGIILFDEITAADRSLQVAAYELILDRRLGDLYKLPDGWLVVAAGNRMQDRAVATNFSSALANRFCHISLSADLESWCTWANSTQIHPDVIAFLRFRPECFFDMNAALEKGWPSPRSWTRVSHVITELSGKLDEVCISIMLEGLVGPAAATEFLAFRRWSLELPDIRAMLNGEAPVFIPERPDQRYALCSAMAYYLWIDGLNPPIKRVQKFFAISKKLSSDFATLALTDVINDSVSSIKQKKTLLLMNQPEFEEWTQLHGSAFSSFLNEAV